MKKRKKELRKLIALKKNQHQSAILKDFSAKIALQLEADASFLAAKTILIYYSMEDEVNTRSFIEKWYKKKTILLPVVLEEKLILRTYSGQASLYPGSYGILEPTGETFTEYSAIDLVIVPGVAFDMQGHRLGRGKGYYDRLLPQINATKIGICFPFQIVKEVPSEEFDILMDSVITCKVTI